MESNKDLAFIVHGSHDVLSKHFTPETKCHVWDEGKPCKFFCPNCYCCGASACTVSGFVSYCEEE